MPAEATLDFLPAETATTEPPVARRDTPQKLPERKADMPPLPRRGRGRSAPAGWLRWALFALLPIALIAGAYWYVTGGQIMSTDDAYVEADKVGVSTDVSGIVQEVDVTENQHVEAGQILYRLDPRQFQIAVDNAKANLAQTALMIESMKQDYRRMLSDIDAQQAQVELDQLTYDRHADLVQRNRFQGQLRPGALRTSGRQEQGRLVEAAGRGSARKARRQPRHSRHRTSAIPAGQGPAR